MELGDAVIVDADKNIVTTEYDDFSNLPEEMVSKWRCRNDNIINSLKVDTCYKLHVERAHNFQFLCFYSRLLRFSTRDSLIVFDAELWNIIRIAFKIKVKVFIFAETSFWEFLIFGLFHEFKSFSQQLS